MNSKSSSVVRKVLIEAIKTQIEDNTPPETKETYDRLLRQGITEEDAYMYLAQALSTEMYHMMKVKREYSRESYVKRLAKLPDID